MKTQSWLMMLAVGAFIKAPAQTCVDADTIWHYDPTADNHTIIISAVPTLNGNPLPAGSYIGVFYDAGGGNLQCGGWQQWNGSPTALPAFGDDTQTPVVKDGFSIGEVFRFKFLLCSGVIVDSIQATYETPPGAVGFLTHTNTFGTNGISQVTVMSGFLGVSCEPADCDDSNACTADTCHSGNCVHTPFPCSVTISGTVSMETGIRVPGVTLYLDGTDIQSSVTGMDGVYAFDVPLNGSYTVTPAKNSDSNSSISIFDIMLVQRHILAVEFLSSPYKIIAANVNAIPPLSILDVILMQSVVLTINSTFPNGKLWTFVPADYVFADSLNPYFYPSSRTYANITSSKGEEDFIGIKLGDVDNTWSPKRSAEEDVHFLIDEFHATCGEEITVPVKVKNFANVTGYQFTLSWDAAVLSYRGVNNQMIPALYGEHRTKEGWLTTLWSDEMVQAVSLDDNAVAFEVIFAVTGAPGSSSEIKIGSGLTVMEAYNENLELINIVPQSGIVKVNDAPVVVRHPSSISHISVQPNPFSHSASIVFTIPQAQTVTMIIYDLTGRQVKQAKKQHDAGRLSFEWHGDDDAGNPLSSGLYHVRITSGDMTRAIKALLIR